MFFYKIHKKINFQFVSICTWKGITFNFNLRRLYYVSTKWILGLQEIRENKRFIPLIQFFFEKIQYYDSLHVHICARKSNLMLNYNLQNFLRYTITQLQ